MPGIVTWYCMVTCHILQCDKSQLVSTSEASAWAAKHGGVHMTVSAATGEGIEHAFLTAFQEAVAYSQRSARR